MSKTALVTGASRGIGREICRALSSDGWVVAVNYQTSAALAEELAREIGGISVCADVADPEAVENMFSRVQDSLGNISLLVNNAGISEYGLLTDLSFERWNRLIAVNLGGAFNCCRAAIPAMVQQNSGCIINISSMWGQAGASCEAAYSASKGGVIALTKALAKELGPSGIRVNSISPGCIETDMMARFSAAELEALRDETPLEALGSPADVAQCVRFLASPAARFITGQTIGVNGGFII